MRESLPTLAYTRSKEELPDFWREVLLWEALLVFAIAFPFLFAIFVPYGRFLPFLAPVPSWLVAQYVFVALTAIGLMVYSVRASAMQRCLCVSFIIGIAYWLVISIASWQ